MGVREPHLKPYQQLTRVQEAPGRSITSRQRPTSGRLLVDQGNGESLAFSLSARLRMPPSLASGQLGVCTENARHVVLQGGLLAGVSVTSVANCGGSLARLAGL